MPVQYKHLPNSPMEFRKLFVTISEELNLPEDAHISIGATSTSVEYAYITFTLPFGVSDLKNKSVEWADCRKALSALTGSPPSAKQPDLFDTPAPTANPDSYDAMSDEVWMKSVSEKMFPSTVDLRLATDLHQPVTGTSGGSVYKTCFIGENLLGACRITGHKISFRFTTPEGKCPSGMALKTLERLGVSTIYEDRVTAHTSMSGTLEEFPAEYRIVFGAYYAGLRPFLSSPFPSVEKLAEGVS